MKKLIAITLMCLFPLFAMAGSCPEIKNFNDPTGQKEAEIKRGNESQKNPSKELFGCFLSSSIPPMTPRKVKGECGCKEVIDKLCSFKKKKHRIRASGGADSAWCAVFAPWAI